MTLSLKLCLHIAQYSGFIIGQVTNSLLLFLILTRAERLFGSYRHVMTVFAFYSLLYTWIEFISQPVMHIKQSMFIVMLDGPFQFQISSGNDITCLYCASFALCISLLAAQFYYRYIAVCKYKSSIFQRKCHNFRPNNLERIRGWKLSVIFVPCLICFVVWFAFVYYGMHNTVEKQKFMRYQDMNKIGNKNLFRDVMIENYDADITQESFIASLYWTYEENGQRILRYRDILGSAGCTFILVCLSFMRREKTSDFRLPVSPFPRITPRFQTLLPFFMMYCPVGALITLPFFEIEVGQLGNFVGAAAGTYPAIEPLIAIFFIKDFRNAVLCKRI
ncbi:hypothetical protein CRE_05684 [Caenorhabditis remanei]|uniref:Uncharacterized protein n=1 Tax=Caenorhabditis remanei TaxID=31234 RepID=E3M0Q8_CAERE|nr:hypothetical protein CRE_05684 [Caenorhabditis remanei]